MNLIVVFLQKAIAQGIAILYGANGEIVTEKSGNLNLGVPGMMYMGGVAGLMGAFLYENSVEAPVPFVGMLIALVCALVCSGLGALIYSVLTISLRANQNVTGLALTTFGMGFGNFFGGSLSRLAGGVGQISTQATASAFRAKIPVLSTLPVVGEVLFSYGFLTYFSIVLTVVLSWFLYRTRKGLNLRAVGENAATADAAGVKRDRLQVSGHFGGRDARGPGRAVFRDGVYRRYLGQQWVWRPRVAGHCAGDLRPLAAAQRYLGQHPLRRAVHSLSLHSRPGPQHAGNLQGPALCGDHSGAGDHQPAQKREDQPPMSLGVAYFREDRG